MEIDLNKISSFISDAIIDLRYATEDNITHKKLYHKPIALLRSEVLASLNRAADQLRSQGYRIVVWDAYRPPNAQKKLRAVCRDDRYIAKVSNHSRGIAVDITLADTSGRYLDMGTGFDDFTNKAQEESTDLTESQKHNRQILKNALEAVGFIQSKFEWWHFDCLLEPTPEVIVVNL